MQLETARLTLRPLEIGDVDDLLEYQSDFQTVAYIPWPQRTREQVRDALVVSIAATEFEKNDDYKLFGWSLKSSGKIIGQSNISIDSKLHSRAEIGWVINPAFKGHGYALEATRAVIGAAFKELGFRRVTAYIDQRNLASIKLARSLGMRLEGSFLEDEYFKQEWTSAHLFAILASEWKE